MVSIDPESGLLVLNVGESQGARIGTTYRLTRGDQPFGRVIVADEDKNSYLDRYQARKQVASGVIEADLGPSTVLTLGHAQQNNRPQGLMWGALPLYYSDGSAIDYDSSASSAPWRGRPLLNALRDRSRVCRR